MSETETEPTTPEPEPVEAPESPPEPEPENPDAEPVEPIEPPGEPPETPQEPSEPSGLSEKEREKQQKDLDRETKRHTERIAALLGDDAEDAILCPLCDPQLQGFLYPAALEHPRDDVQARMIEVLLQPEQVEYLPDPDVDRCERCGGLGKTDTRSKVPGQDRIVCKRCKGAGYFPPPGTIQNGLVPDDEGRQLVAVGASEPVIEDQDAWGSPRLMADGQENPNYGKMPQYKNPSLP